MDLRNKKRDIIAASIIAVLIFLVIIGWLFFRAREVPPGLREEEIEEEPSPREPLPGGEGRERAPWEEVIPGQPVPEGQKMCLQIPSLVIPLGSIEVASTSLNEFVGLPDYISIPWPESLKKINVMHEECFYKDCLAKYTKICEERFKNIESSCERENKIEECLELYTKQCECTKGQTDCICKNKDSLTYKLPCIPFSKLSYKKEVSVKIPGFQSLPKASLSALLNFPSCVSQKPTGGNPCLGQLKGNLAEIQQIKANIEEASKNIINILE